MRGSVSLGVIHAELRPDHTLQQLAPLAVTAPGDQVEQVAAKSADVGRTEQDFVLVEAPNARGQDGRSTRTPSASSAAPKPSKSSATSSR